MPVTWMGRDGDQRTTCVRSVRLVGGMVANLGRRIVKEQMLVGAAITCHYGISSKGKNVVEELNECDMDEVGGKL